MKTLKQKINKGRELVVNRIEDHKEEIIDTKKTDPSFLPSFQPKNKANNTKDYYKMEKQEQKKTTGENKMVNIQGTEKMFNINIRRS